MYPSGGGHGQGSGGFGGYPGQPPQGKCTYIHILIYKIARSRLWVFLSIGSLSAMISAIFWNIVLSFFCPLWFGNFLKMCVVTLFVSYHFRNFLKSPCSQPHYLWEVRKDEQKANLMAYTRVRVRHDTFFRDLR